MAKLTSLFSNGVMEKDLDRSFIPNGSFRNAQNLRFHINEGNDGVATNIKGTLLVSDETSPGIVFKCVCAYFNADKNVVYYFLASPTGQYSKIVEYDIIADATVVIIEDDASILKFNYNSYITGINEINGLLIFSEWGNNPRRVNIERAKTYGLSGFTEEDIMIAVIPPHQKLRITLQNTISVTGQENFLEEKMIAFSFRYRYVDGEYSALAPFTNYAFEPKDFNYNYTDQSNLSMLNTFNQVKIEFFTGGANVTEIQLVFKESNSNSEFIIDDFNKEKLGYADNAIETFLFDNSKTYRALPDTVLRSYFDNVPREAKAQTIIEGRLIIANYKEQYDLKDIEGNDINIDYRLILESLDNTIEVLEDELDEDGNPTGSQILVPRPSLEPKRTIKSNRDVQIGIVYLDDHGRSTTVLVSKTNTLYIPTSASDTENKIKVELSETHKPPYWAKYYRFFISENEKDYDQTLPTIFFQEGVYRYIKIEQSDIDKFKEGDYVIIKADGNGVLNTLEKVKILEFERKEKDFISEDNGGQPSGWYMKISTIDTNLSFDNTNYIFIENKHYDESSDVRIITSNETNYFEVNYNGNDTSPLSASVTYSGANDLRYYIEMTDVLSSPNTFRWRSQQTNGTFSSFSPPINADTVPVALDADVSVSFVSATGLSIDDKWVIIKKIGFLEDQSNRSYAVFPILTQITAGTRIKMKYFSVREKSPSSQSFLFEQIANQNYQNLEEWYFNDEIYSLMEADPGFDFTDQRVWIRRVNLTSQPDSNGFRARNFIDISPTGSTYVLIIESEGRKDSAREIYSDVFTEVRRLENLPIIETVPKKQSPEIFYEIGKTYKVINNLHSCITADWETQIPTILSDQSQTATLPLIVTLDWFNAWSFGNGVESYKIQDQFNKPGLNSGVRVLTAIKDKYKEVTRIADITWSDVYNEDSDFNGLNWFNLSNANFILLDKENGGIQLIDNDNSNLLVLQENAIGIMPYNKEVIFSATGDPTISVSNNVLDSRSWRSYAGGEHGISKNPESYVKVEGRKYFTDQQRGNIIQLSNDGVTTINQYGLEYEMSNIMAENKVAKFVAGYDFKHKEYIVNIPSRNSCLSYQLTKNGFNTEYLFEPDFMLNANNDFYAWKNGVMYKMNTTTNYNEFFGVQSVSKIIFYQNTEPLVKKIWKNIALQSNKQWSAIVSTNLTATTIPESDFEKIEEYYHAPIRGNTNTNTESNSVFGLGSYPIVNGNINAVAGIPSTISVGDTIYGVLDPSIILTITNISDTLIETDSPLINAAQQFLVYSKNQFIDGQSVRGDILEVELTYSDTDEVILRAVDFEVAQSNY